MFIARLVYVGLDQQSCVKGVSFMRNEQFVVVMWISYSLSSRKHVRLWELCCKFVV